MARKEYVHEHINLPLGKGKCTCPTAIVCRGEDMKVAIAILEAAAKENPCPRHSSV